MINVLVVEDEPPIQRMICKTISEMDREFSVRYTAFNGIQAQRILEAEEVDVYGYHDDWRRRNHSSPVSS